MNTVRKIVTTLTFSAFMIMAGTVPAVAESDLTVLDWAGYEEPNFFQEYMDKYDEAPDFSYFANEEEAYNKIRTGFGADLSHPCLANVPKWRDAGLIEPIDTSKLEHWDEVLDDLRTLKGVKLDGKVWMVPFEWGYTSIVYRTDAIERDDVNLDMFVDPEFRNRVSLPDNVDDVYALASLAVGLDSWENMTDEQFDQATDWLRRANKNVRFYWGDVGQLNQAMAANEVSLAWTWSQTYTTLTEEGQPVAMNRDPKKGISSWVCGYVDVKHGNAPEEEVYDFLDALIAPASGKYMIESWGYAPANAKSFEIANQATVERAAFDDVEALLSESFFQDPPAPDLKAKMTRAFERVKSGF